MARPYSPSGDSADASPRQPRGRTVERLAAGFQRFQKRWYCAENNLYADLAEGQSPRALVIACSDSRVDPALLTDSCPGDLFVIRNVANIVPPYAPDGNYHGVSAALEYAVRYLKVPDIIVMGHAECGGVQSLLDKVRPQQDEFLSIWVQVIHRARELVNSRLPHASPEERRRACEMWGVRVSMENLLTFPWIRQATENGQLTLHGWYFDLGSGELLQWDEAADEFLPLVTPCAPSGDKPDTASA